MTGSGIVVQNTLACHRVNDALSLLEGFSSGGLVAGGDELAHLLDGGAVLAALGGEMQVARNRLTGALASLFGIGHLCFLKNVCLMVRHTQY